MSIREGNVGSTPIEISSITVGPLQENCYLLVDVDSRDAVVVDPGDEAHRIIDVIDSNQARLTAIWLTHGHVDHVGAAAPLVEAYNVPVFLHPSDLPLYERAAVTGRMYGMNFEQPPAPDRELREGDVVSCGTVFFQVLHVPGHSPGQVAFVGNGVCLSGDLLFAGSIGRTDLPLSNPADMQRSLHRISTLADDVVVLPGHGDVTTIGREKLGNPFLRGLARPIGS
jgi:glyoxylase-like metal-dependent hydrolase (beta-lactamase superfamily II)